MRFLTLLLPLFLLTGCMHRSTISTETPAADLEKVNRQIAGRTGTMTVQSGEVLWGKDFQVGNNATTWRPLHTESRAVMPNAQIDEIEVPNRGKGLVEGFLYGSTIGACLSIALQAAFYSALANDPGPDSENSLSKNETSASVQVIEYTLIGAAIGAGFGVAIGGAGGSKQIVRFVRPDVKR